MEEDSVDLSWMVGKSRVMMDHAGARYTGEEYNIPPRYEQHFFTSYVFVYGKPLQHFRVITIDADSRYGSGMPKVRIENMLINIRYKI